MSTSQFDPSVFLDAQVTEVNEKRPPLPTENPEHPNGLYLAVIGEITTGSGTISKGDNAGKPWVSMIIPLRVQVPPSVQGLGIPPEVTLSHRNQRRRHPLGLAPAAGQDRHGQGAA